MGTSEMKSSTQPETEAILHRTAFSRLAVLIVGPTGGAWSGYNQEMLRTMALLPGVVSLGRMTAHSGRPGLGFSTGNVVLMNPRTGIATALPPSPVVLLDPETGALLEARNFSIPVLESAAQDFVGSPTAAVYANGVSYGVSTEWIDPVPGPSVVDQSALPAWISGFHSIEAIGNPDVNGQTLADVINPYLGDGNSDIRRLEQPYTEPDDLRNHHQQPGHKCEHGRCCTQLLRAVPIGCGEGVMRSTRGPRG